MKHIGLTIQAVASGALVYISAKLEILFPVLLTLTGLMAVDYITGMMASKVKDVDHPKTCQQQRGRRTGVVRQWLGKD